MNIVFRLILAVIVPVLLTVALAYAQGFDESQPETVSIEEVLQSLD